MKKIFILMTFLMTYCGFSQIVEGENGNFYNGAGSQACATCSGGNQAGDIGYNGTDSKYFTSVVSVATPGIYTMNLSFISGDTRTLYVSANGNTPVQLALKSADWSTVGTQNLQVSLHQGTNTIKFYNDFDYAPNIDKFELTLLQAASTCADCYGPFEAEAATITGLAVAQACTTCSGGQKVGEMGYGDRYITQSVNVTTAGKYRIYISYISGAERSISVTANGGTTVSGNCFSANWDVVFVKALDINLTAGVNSLKFHTPGAWSPNIDKFRLELLDNNANLTDLKVNGVTISGFNANTTSYNYPLALNTAVPQITLTSLANTTATRVISQNPTSSTVVVTASDGVTTKTYTVNYVYSSISVESETGSLFGGASSSANNCSSCSNTQKVGDMGYGKYVTNTVRVPAKGTYTMVLSFISGSPRTMFISANGFRPISRSLNSNDWGVVATESFQIELEQGANTIKFYNPTNYAPDVDKFTLALTTAATQCTDCYGPFEAESGTLSGLATTESCTNSCSGGVKVIDMGYSDRFVTHNVTVAKAGKYKLYLSYSSGDNRSMSVTPNGNDFNTVSAICNSGDYSVVFVQVMEIDLLAGNNSLKFHTPGNWSPNFDKFKLEFIEYSKSFEAEAGNLFSGAAVQACATCSNGQRVGDIGTNRFLTHKVVVPTRGIYTMNISFTSGTTRSILVTANGNTAVQADLNSGGWDTVGTKEIQLELYEGANTIKFYNDASSGPNLDKFTLTLTQASSPCRNDCFGPLESEDGVVNAPASVQNCSNCSGDKHVGDMGFGDRFVTSQVQINTAGTYRIYLSYSSGSTRNISVTATQGGNTATVSASCNSTDWGVTFVKTLDIALTAGLNSLKFHNPGDWAPNVDKFSLERLTTNANLVDLEVDGIDLAGFDPNTIAYTYNVSTGSTAVPQITTAKTRNASSTRVITQATAVPGSATVFVTGSNGTSTKTYTINFAFQAQTQTVWNGKVSNVWTTAANWDSGVPNRNSEVFIGVAPIQPVISSNVHIDYLEIEPDGILNLNSGSNLTVTDLIVNAGELNIANNANLIQINNVANTGLGTTTVIRNSNALSRGDYSIWSSPVDFQNLLDFSPATLTNRFYSYNETTSKYSIVPNLATTDFEVGAGYLIRMPDNAVVAPLTQTFEGTFEGTLNNGNISRAVTHTNATRGYNMVGNPYPSSIDAAEFIAANTSKIEGNLYFWRKVNAATGSAYAVYNGLGTTATPSSEIPNGTIQVGQGFFVKTKPGATSIDFTNAMRNGTKSTQFFRTKQVAQKDRLWLNLSNASGLMNQILIGYTANASVSVDEFDAEYINDSPIALTSTIDSKEYSIQARPSFDVTDMVSLNFKTDVDGDFNISLDKFDGAFADAQEVYLVDALTGTETNIKTNAYNFSALAGSDANRFTIKFQKTLKVDDNIFDENTINVYRKNGNIVINSGKNTMNNIKVYDLQGRMIFEQKNVKSSNVTLSNLKAKNQVLIVKIKSENNIEVSKKVLN